MFKSLVFAISLASALLTVWSLEAIGRLADGEVEGTVTFKQLSVGIEVSGTFSGLKPGKHGFHIHEFANFTDGCISTGSHFNPYMKLHGSPNSPLRHVGDLGNIVANETGIAEFYFIDTIISFEGEANILNRAFVVHELEDDLGTYNETSTSTGNAGGRLHCAEIIKTDGGSGGDGDGAAVMGISSFMFVLCLVTLLS